MSLDYPNRAEWLVVRNTPRKLPHHNFLHVSAKLAWIPKHNDPITGATIPGRYVVGATSTYNIGRNAAKRVT